MVEVTMAVPWRPGQLDREIHHDYVVDALRAMLPEAKVLDGIDTKHRRFSRAATRNEAMRQAERGVVVICDADTLPEQAPLEKAIAAAAKNGRMHLPYTRFRGLSREGTLAVYARGIPLSKARVQHRFTHSTGGVIVMHTDAWWQAGGMDERFLGWGFEDSAFRYQVERLLGPLVRHRGTIYHLWHPSEAVPESTEYKANAALARRYQYARTRAQMQALIGERP